MTTTAALLEDVEQLGFPVLGASREGRAIVGGMLRPLVPRTTPDATASRYRSVLVFAGIHGDEPQTVEALLEWVRVSSLWRAAAAGGTAAAAADDPTVWVLPVLNPDGLARNHKDAASGVDLNRNFPARNFSVEHPPGYDPGPHPLSEPETSLLARVIERAQIDAVVALHAPFACVNWDGPAEGWSAAISSASKWPLRRDLGYPTPGSLGSWLGVDRGLPVVTLELPAGRLNGYRQAALSALDSAIAYAFGATARNLSGFG